MNISISKDTLLVRTRFSDNCDLVQKFTGVTEYPSIFNHPINFTEAGFISPDTNDEWHIELPLAISTDEATPMWINNMYLGANHEFYGAVALRIADHGKAYCDIGSLWRDAEGTSWTLIALDADSLTFISENIGKDDAHYNFKSAISLPLTCDDDVIDGCTQFMSVLSPIIRHTERRVIAYQDGSAMPVYGSAQCDAVEIREAYEIVSPASMARAIRDARPFSAPVTAALGEAMVEVTNIYRVEDDGTVLCDFKRKKLMDVDMTRCMGAMFQLKIDAFGGGLYRYIPKLRKFKTPEGEFDFSRPVALGGSYPSDFKVTPEFWAQPDTPPDRIIDYFMDEDGKAALSFACGYLPVYDGIARAAKLDCAIDIVKTRKAYPFFMTGDLNELHGVAYRKYFPEPYYTISLDGKTYLFFDFFKADTIKAQICGDVHPLEMSDGVSYCVNNNTLTVSAAHGYAVFEITQR